MDDLSLTRHERRRLQTHKLLIETTLQLIFEKGYDAVSVQDITDRADLGRGTFYIHFKDKEDIVWIAIRDSIQVLEQASHRQFEKGLPPQAEYYGLLNIFLHAEKNRQLYSLMFGGKGAAAITARVHDLMADIFLRDIHAAPAPSDIDFHLPEEIEAQILTGVITRLIYWWLEKPNNYTAEQMAAIIYKALYRKGPPIAP